MASNPSGHPRRGHDDGSARPQDRRGAKRKIPQSVPQDFSQLYNDDYDGPRPTILFDLNGVLIQQRIFIEEKKHIAMTKNGRSQRLCFPRPGLRHLASLCPYFRIGLYTSARLGSVAPRAKEIWQQMSKETTVKDFMEYHQVPKRKNTPSVPGAFFGLVLDRAFCRPDPNWQQRPGGSCYDSVKPLSLHGFNPQRTLIVDDSLRKILPEEQPNAIILPQYITAADPTRASEPDDAPLPLREPDGVEDPLGIPCRLPVLRALVILLLHHVAGVSGDVRPALERVRQDLDQAISTGSLPEPLAHLREAPPEPGCHELPLLFLSPPEQAPYGTPRQITR